MIALNILRLLIFEIRPDTLEIYVFALREHSLVKAPGKKRCPQKI